MNVLSMKGVNFNFYLDGVDKMCFAINTEDGGLVISVLEADFKTIIGWPWADDDNQKWHIGPLPNSRRPIPI